MTSLEIQRLLDETLLGDYDDEEPWGAVSALRRNGNREIFETAASWLRESDPLKRARGAAILAQLRAPSEEPMKEPKWLYREETFPLLVELLEHESDALVLASAIAALGHLYNEAGIPIIVRYKDHPDQDVRYSVTCALGHFPDDPLSVATLIPLTKDEDSDVRDWAVFGLGVQGSVDSAEIREALLRRLLDPDEDVREEAAVGLGVWQRFDTNWAISPQLIDYE
jgi:HEAT repeats